MSKKWEKIKTDEGILYTYIASDNDTRTCLFKNDMTVEIRCNGLLSKYPSEKEIEDLKVVDELLKKIRTAELCAGVEQGYNCPTTLFHRKRSLGRTVKCRQCQLAHKAAWKRQFRRRMRLDVSGESEADRACIAKNCPGRDSGDIRLHPIPENDIEAWCENLKIITTDVTPDMRVCSRHFEESFVKPRTLKFGARPTLNLGHNDPVQHDDQTMSRPKIYHCCIMGCDTTSPPDTVFLFPTNIERYNEWLLICVIKNEFILNKKKYICRKHFDPSMFHDTKLKKNVLKKDAMPKMDAVSWLKNNANAKIDEFKAAKSVRLPKTVTNTKQLPPTVQAIAEIQNALVMKFEDDSKSDHNSNSFEGLQCKNVCLTCAKAFKDCETYREACSELEIQLQALQARREELQNQNEILMAELESSCVVYEEEIQCD